jgi:hypothetical protein
LNFCEVRKEGFGRLATADENRARLPAPSHDPGDPVGLSPMSFRVLSR